MVRYTARSLGFNVSWDSDMSTIGRAQIWQFYKWTMRERIARGQTVKFACQEMRDQMLRAVKEGIIGQNATDELPWAGGYLSFFGGERCKMPGRPPPPPGTITRDIRTGEKIMH